MSREKNTSIGHILHIEERYFIAQVQPQRSQVEVGFSIALFSVFLLLFLASGITAILGITGKLKIKDKYLGPLFGAIFLQGIVPGIMLFFRPDILFPSISQDTVENRPSPSSPPINNQDDQIQQLTSDLEKLTSDVEKLTNENMELEEDLENLQQNFLVRLSEFHRDASEFGLTLNFTYPPHDQKRGLAKRFLELLSEMGHYTGEIVAEPEVAKLALEQYQKSLGFTKIGWYSQDVFIIMVKEYIE